MNLYFRVRRASRTMAPALLLTAAITACDPERVAPTGVATSPAATVDVTDDQNTNIRPGEYQYRGCFTEARSYPWGSATVVFDPPVCVPITLVILEGGWWYLYDPDYNPPEHPGLTVSIGDIWSGVSRNGKCRHTGDGSGRGCVAETRYVRSMIFGTGMVDVRFNGAWYRATQRVSWTYSPGRP